MPTKESKREILRDKVVDLVKEFIRTEGGITAYDLQGLFGRFSPDSYLNEIANVLAKELVFY